MQTHGGKRELKLSIYCWMAEQNSKVNKQRIKITKLAGRQAGMQAGRRTEHTARDDEDHDTRKKRKHRA